MERAENKQQGIGQGKAGEDVAGLSIYWELQVQQNGKDVGS